MTWGYSWRTLWDSLISIQKKNIKAVKMVAGDLVGIIKPILDRPANVIQYLDITRKKFLHTLVWTLLWTVLICIWVIIPDRYLNNNNLLFC